MNNNLALKVQIGLALALSGLMVLLFGATFLFEKQKLEQAFAEYEKDTLASLAVTMAQPVFTYDFEQIEAILSVTLEQEQIAALKVFDHRGKPMASVGSNTGEDAGLEQKSISFSEDRKSVV